MKDVVSTSNEDLLVAGVVAPAVTGVVGAATGVVGPVEAGGTAKSSETVDRPSLFCSLDGTCVNPHDAIPLNTRDTFARNFMSHFAAALGESQHAA